MKEKMLGVVAIDDGGANTVVVTESNVESFPSVKGYYGNRNLTEPSHKHDFIVEYRNQKYVCGLLAKYDNALPIQMNTESKQHLFYDLSVLIALHQYGYASNSIVVSVPIRMYNEKERDGRLNRLKGSHTITVNGATKTFAITDVKIAPETASAFWINEPQGKIRYLDFGSRTIGFATTVNEDGVIRFIDTESGTEFGKGIAALGNSYSPRGLADYICGILTKSWGPYDKVYLLGGGSLDIQLASHIKEYFPKAQVLDEPVLSNAKGMYQLGVKSYGLS